MELRSRRNSLKIFDFHVIGGDMNEGVQYITYGINFHTLSLKCYFEVIAESSNEKVNISESDLLGRLEISRLPFKCGESFDIC